MLLVFVAFAVSAVPPAEQAAHDAICPQFSGMGGSCTVGKPPCNEAWTVCENGRVVALNLDGELVGPFPNVNGFSLLRNLSFVDGFAMNLPRDLSQMSTLSTLTHFSVGPATFGVPWAGSVLPASVGTAWPNLQVFILHSAENFGQLPASINSWSKLRIFNLINTNADCLASPPFALPLSLSGWSAIEKFLIWNTCVKPNQPIPILGAKVNLTSYDIRDTVPDASTIPGFTLFDDDGVFDSTKMREFSMDSLALCAGTMPATLGHATSLRNFAILNTDMTGSIPNNVFNLKKLETITLNRGFTGTLPSTIGGWKSLEVMFLLEIDMSGSIPTEIGLLTNLNTLFLNNNGPSKFSGAFPTQLADLAFKNLTGLVIFDTNIGGIIPEPSVRTGPCRLETIILTNSLFTCTLPDWIVEILPNISPFQCNFINNKFCLFPKPLQEADGVKCQYAIEHPLCLCDECPHTLQEPQSCPDCNGVPMGSSSYDACDVCDGDSLSCADCNGVPNGPATYDVCDVCGGNNGCTDCNGLVGGTATYDVCDVCSGDNTSCLDCLGAPFGTSAYDACDVCNGDGLTCQACDGGTSNQFEIDLCGNCVNMTLPAYKPSCFDCFGVANGTAIRDLCGVCNGTNSACNAGQIGAGVVGQRTIVPWLIAFGIVDFLLVLVYVFVRRRSANVGASQPVKYQFFVRSAPRMETSYKFN